MKIGFDAKRVFHNSTGLGNYSRTLIKNLQRYYPEHEYFLFTPSVTENSYTRPFLTGEFQIVTPQNKIPGWRSVFSSRTIERLDLDIYHGLSHEIPLVKPASNTSMVVTIHDLIFLNRASDYNRWDRWSYNYKYKRAAQSCDALVAISNYTRDQVRHHWDIEEKKIHTIYQSCNDVFFQPSIAESDRSYFLYVGSVVKRKGLLYIIEALGSCPGHTRPKLVVVGRGGSYYAECKERIRALKMENQVDFKENVSTEELKRLYDQALALVFPSREEGFGIPVIEAGLRKTPVITSRYGALQESAGPYATYIDLEQPDDLKNALLSHLIHDDKRAILIEKSYIYVESLFNPEATARSLYELYVNLRT